MKTITEQGKKKSEKLAVASKYYLLAMLLSFLGWLWETAYVSAAKHRFCDRGFMLLPFCPIYGGTLLVTFFLLGTPNERRGLLKNVRNAAVGYALYIAFAFLIPSFAELFVGLFFDKAFHVRLWNYSSRPLNLGGYVCVPVSLAWAAAITLFMRFVFPHLKNTVFRISNTAANVAGALLLIAMLADFAFGFLGLL